MEDSIPLWLKQYIREEQPYCSVDCGILRILIGDLCGHNLKPNVASWPPKLVKNLVRIQGRREGSKLFFYLQLSEANVIAVFPRIILTRNSNAEVAWQGEKLWALEVLILMRNKKS